MALSALAIVAVGCGTGPTRSSGGSPPADPETEPNDNFNQAQKAIFNNAAVAKLAGTIDNRDDLDVFDIGPLAAGDRVSVDLDSVTDDLDPSIALFDADLNLFMDNDDENLEAGDLDPYVNEVVRHDADPYYLVVGRSAFGGFSADSGEYLVTVRVEPADPVPDPKPQVLFLNFSGGEIEPDNLLVSEVRPFEAALIDPVYEGQDEIIMASIIETVRENYEAFDVVVVTDPADLPAEGQYSTIMFGSRSVRAFGISESVDHYNGDHGDMAIIFTESFDPMQFESTPTAEQLGVAIGNIGAHESGHLLGLNHVDDPADLMDAVSPADTFLADQEFKMSLLSSDILPIGYQDGPLLLSEIVGLLEGYTLPLRGIIRADPGPRLKHPSSAYWCATCNRKLELTGGSKVGN